MTNSAIEGGGWYLWGEIDKIQNSRREFVQAEEGISEERAATRTESKDGAGGEGHLRRWLLPSVGESWCGPGKAGWAHTLQLHQFALAPGWNATSHFQITCGSRTCTDARRCVRTLARTPLASGSRGASSILTQLTLSAVIWHFAVLNVCLTALHSCQKPLWVALPNEKCISPLWVGHEPKLQYWQRE